MKTYDNYKDSGIDWIGEIPSDWDVKKLKYLAFIKTGYTPLTSVEENFSIDGFVWVKPDNLNEFVPITDSKDKINGDSVKKQNIVPKGSILLCCIGSIGKFGIAGVDLTTNQQINSITFNEQMSFGYGKYLIFCCQCELEKASNGNVVRILNTTALSSLAFPAPTFREQTQIAQYLDQKTSQIDKLISDKQKLIELLKEERTAVINQAVTKGLNPDVPMKDSGISWFGEIPQHWQLKKLKHLCSLISEKTQSANNGQVILLENIESWTGKLLGQGTAESVVSDLNLFGCNDILFSKLRPYLAKVVLAEVPGVCAGELLVLRTSPEILPKFLFYRMISEMMINIIDGSTYGSKMPRASWSNFISQLYIPICSIDEQRNIIYKIEQTDRRITALTKMTAKEIELLKEYRIALISEAVTGKIDVRDDLPTEVSAIAS